MQIGNKNFSENRTYVMGILNVTPDSFSDGGKFNNLDFALKHTEQMIKDGADVIDIGGESTRPGYTMISDDEEISRIVPVITAVKNNFDIPVSVDTYKSAVAKEAILAGADLVNDIWGFKYDNKIAKITAEYNKTCCLMHNRKEAVYNDFMSDVLSDLEESIKIALDVGVKKENIMLDPGVGFAKSYEQNLEITNKCEQLLTLGYPVLLGTSRKSMIGLTLDLPANQRVEGTLATSVLAVIKNLMFVRVHDVLENKRIITMTEKILGKF
jgi:dihydropteroate synthase